MTTQGSYGGIYTILLLVTCLQSSFYKSIFKDAQLWQLWCERSHCSKDSGLVCEKPLLSFPSNIWSKINQPLNESELLSSNLRSALSISDIGLKYYFTIHCFLVYAVLSLNWKTNTGLFKGCSLFASCLLLRQMFQGTREDTNTCTLGVGGGEVSRCLSNAKCERIPIHCFLL